MFKILRNNKVLLCGFLPTIVHEEIDIEKYKELRGLYVEDPWERVKCIFSRDDHGEIHPELKYAKDMFYVGALAGCFYGGVFRVLLKAEGFVRINQATTYMNSREAIKAFMDNNTLLLFKGAIKWAPVFGFFSAGFSLVASCCEAYRGKPHIIDSSAAGFIVGGLTRFMFGIKGMISGGVVGGVLGSVYGLTVWSLSKLLHTNQTELKYTQFAYSNYKKQLLNNLRTQKPMEDKIIEKTGLHPSHVMNPMNELDSQDQPVNNTKENVDK